MVRRRLFKLTARSVASATKPGLVGDGGGLWLKTGPTGSKSWVFRYMVSGTARGMGLGSCNTLTLLEARERARYCRQLLLDGVDPMTSAGPPWRSGRQSPTR